MKRLAPSFGGGARFIPEKDKQSIAEIYTFLSSNKTNHREEDAGEDARRLSF